MGNKSLGLLVGLALVLSVSAFLRPAQIDKVEVQKGPQGERGEAGQNLGAFPGADVNSPFLSVNGAQEFYYSQAFNNASSSLCAFKSPDATSTMLYGNASVFTGSSTETVLIEATRNTVYDATTSAITSFGFLQLPSTLNKGVLIATSTGNSTPNNSTRIFPPNNWLVFKAVFGINTGATNSLGGRCNAKFQAF